MSPFCALRQAEIRLESCDLTAFWKTHRGLILVQEHREEKLVLFNCPLHEMPRQSVSSIPPLKVPEMVPGATGTKKSAEWPDLDGFEERSRLPAETPIRASPAKA